MVLNNHQRKLKKEVNKENKLKYSRFRFVYKILHELKKSLHGDCLRGKLCWPLWRVVLASSLEH